MTDGLGPEHEDRGERGIYHKGNRLNDLTGKEWVYATRSVINKHFPPSYQHALRSQHGGQKPPELCAELIRVFTKPGMRVLDPFMGVGGTLLGATLSDRQAVGVEQNPRWVEIYQEVCRREGLAPQTALIGDSREILPTLSPTFDLLLTDVPYWNMDTRRRSSGTFKRAGGASAPRRRSKLTDFRAQADEVEAEGGGAATPDHGLHDREAWLDLLRTVFATAAPLLRPRAYVIVFIGDMYHSGEYHPLSQDVTSVLRQQGWTMKANLIWYDVAKKLNIYGYRYEFIPSMIHQNVLVFRV